jgi:hypothetical protein
VSSQAFVLARACGLPLGSTFRSSDVQCFTCDWLDNRLDILYYGRG